MISVWTVIGLLVLSVVSGVFTGVAVAIVGGMGVVTALRKRLENVEISQENLDRRLTTEVKARAAVKGVEARQEAKSVEEQARVRLATESAPTGPGRPSIISLIRR